MLKPAILYKKEIEEELKKYFYTDEMMFYQGYTVNKLIEVEESGDFGNFQYAVVGSCCDLIGYISYRVDYYSKCAYNFGAFSFVEGNPIFGKDLYGILESMIENMHKTTFTAISGNPAVRGYDKFLKKHNDIGTKHILKDDFKDTSGIYHDRYVYEFINNKI